MGRPYSIDLRERVVALVLQDRQSRNKAASHFGVAVSTAISWVKRYQETGSVEPGQMGGHKPKAIRGEHEIFLTQRVREGPLRCVDWCANSPITALKSIIVQYGTSSTPKSSALKKNRCGERTRPARRRPPARTVG